jgi:CRP/FNR family transcriptional regulator, dissimilatory nitrate respiration regulator
MNRLSVNKLSVAYSHPLLDHHPQLWAPYLSQLQKQTFGTKETVLLHGDEASALWLVISGWLILTRQTPDGKETVVGLCTQGDMFGEAALFPHARYPYSAVVAGSDAELLPIPAAILRELLVQEPALSARVMQLMNERTAQAQLKLEHMTTLSAAQRLGCFLLKLCQTQAKGERVIHIPVEKHILATYLGMKAETLSRSQQQLREVGVTVVGSALTIHSIERLRDYVCNSCSEFGGCES